MPAVVKEVKGIGEVVDCTRFSSTDKTLRITNVLRFIGNLRAKNCKILMTTEMVFLSTEEIFVSKKHWLKHEQLFIVNRNKIEKG